MVDHFSKIGRDTGIIILMILSGKKFSGRTRYHSSWKKTVQDNTIWFGKFFFSALMTTWIKEKATQTPRTTYCVGNYSYISHNYSFNPRTRESRNAWKAIH